MPTLEELGENHPGTNDVKAYKAIEKYVKAGKIRSIGLSNYYIKEMTEFLPKVDIKPVLVQNEIHPYYQERRCPPHGFYPPVKCFTSFNTIRAKQETQFIAPIQLL